MKKVVIALLLIIPIIGVNTVNNKNYELETVTNTYTKEEIDSKLEELRTSINNNKTSIEENKNILTTIQNKLNDYALKTALNKANSNIDSLNTIVTNNTNKITNLENLFKEGTAKASEILSGKTAIVGGNKITGSMTNWKNQNIWINEGNGKFIDNYTYTYSDGKTVNNMYVFNSNKSGYFNWTTNFLIGPKDWFESNIKSGAKVLGVTGTYTSDATATASDIASGKTAYVNGKKITGTGSGAKILYAGTVSLHGYATSSSSKYISAQVSVGTGLSNVTCAGTLTDKGDVYMGYVNENNASVSVKGNCTYDSSTGYATLRYNTSRNGFYGGGEGTAYLIVIQQ